ncbi:MAG: DUF418 domain-containing protein [Mobilicoccus sp.]|nr:DUF418 domain-containing protein [Mobilicoccus sp.]
MSTPAPVPRRVLAPDLARGAMLLLIALANVPAYLWGPGQGLSATAFHPPSTDLLDRIVQAVTIVTIDGRVYPMFTFLLGYGMWQFARARRAQGVPEPDVRRLLRRRHLGLLLIGAVHAALLFSGDVLGAYGILGLVMVPLFFACSSRTLAWWCAGLTVALLVFLGMSAALDMLFGAADPAALDAAEGFFPVPNVETDYLAAMGGRLLIWGISTPTTALIGSILPSLVLLSWIAARAEVLERPGDHLPLLRRVAAIGIAIGWLGGIPAAAVHLGVLPAAHLSWALTLSMVSGFVCGVGYVAAFALLAHRLTLAELSGATEGTLRRVLVATGRASLTCYLFQSVVFAPLFDAWGLGAGEHVGSAAAAGIAVLTWAASALLATWLLRTGRRGPGEIALRRITGSSRPA